jgi:hypothetical protein
VSLKSALLFPPGGGDPRINLAYSDRNHPIAFGEPQSDAVRRIQSALRDLGFGLPKSFSAAHAFGFDGIFGDETLKAVRAFQRTHPPLRVDGMVGQHTLDEMDSSLLRPKPPSGPQALAVVPFHETTNMLISAEAHSLTKSDLEDTPSTPVLPKSAAGLYARKTLADARKSSTSDLERNMRLELFVGGGTAGMEVLHAFRTNLRPKAEITFGVSSTLAKLVQASSVFRRANETVKSFVTDALSESATSGILDYEALRESGKKVPPPRIGFSGFDPLHFVVGSFQGSNIFLEDYSANPTDRTYRAVLIYELIDHFGADDSDLVPDLSGHGSSGQVALWVLQRERHPNHEPFVLKVQIEETISDHF